MQLMSMIVLVIVDSIMSMDIPKCPYNSVYTIVESRNKNKKMSIVCCQHGKPCVLNENNMKKEDGAYVNLMKEVQQDRNACEVSDKTHNQLQELANRLREVEMKSAKKKEKKRAEKKKKKREMVRMEKILNDAAELTFIEESHGKKDFSELNESEVEAFCKAMFSMNSNTSNKKKKDKKERSNISISNSLANSDNRRQKKQKTPNEELKPVKAKYVEESNVNRSMYIGMITKTVAEKNVKKRGDFYIYHQAEKYNNMNDIPTAIKLFMVCKTDEGFRHDQIRQASSPSGKTNFYVEKGEQAMVFKSIDELVSYYQVQSLIHPEEFLM